MKRVLLTGLPGTGKSTVMGMLAALGYRAVESDLEDWSEMVNGSAGPELIWREDRIQFLLSTDDADVLFVSGCARNQVKFYPQFDDIVLFSAPIELIVERLATRTNNTYGKHPAELTLILQQKETVEPWLRQAASLEVDTSAPVAQVLETVLGLVPPVKRVSVRRIDRVVSSMVDRCRDALNTCRRTAARWPPHRHR